MIDRLGDDLHAEALADFRQNLQPFESEALK